MSLYCTLDRQREGSYPPYQVSLVHAQQHQLSFSHVSSSVPTSFWWLSTALVPVGQCLACTWSPDLSFFACCYLLVFHVAGHLERCAIQSSKTLRLGWQNDSFLDFSSCPLWRTLRPFPFLILRKFPHHHGFSRTTVGGFKMASAHRSLLVFLDASRLVPWMCSWLKRSVRSFFIFYPCPQACPLLWAVIHSSRFCYQTKGPGRTLASKDQGRSISDCLCFLYFHLGLYTLSSKPIFSFCFQCIYRHPPCCSSYLLPILIRAELSYS